jgi:predicted NBD/HSP70 family sugar kinase
MSRAGSERSGPIVVGIDIGGTKTAVVALALPDADAKFREVIATQAAHGADRLRAELGTVLARLQSELGLRERPPVSVSVPELVDLDGVVTTDVVVPGLAGDLKEWAELGVVRVESDVRAAARAEARVGAGRGFPSITYVSIGTGISSTFVLNGAAWPGAHGAAILLGSGSLGPGRGSDSSPYILEELASGAAIVETYQSLGGHAGSAREVLDLYSSDPLAAQVVDQAGHAAGHGVAVLVNLLDPHVVIVGGGLGCVDGPYWRCLQTSARAHIWADAARDVPLLRSGLGPDAAAIGAALAARADAR